MLIRTERFSCVFKNKILPVFCFLFCFSPALTAHAQDSFLESFTVEGAPIATKHFQTSDENYRERHGLVIAKAATREYGNWGLYFLNPNSVDDTSFGAGYVTDPYTVPMGSTIQLELSGALGLVTGYQDYPIPLLAGEARLALYESGAWNVGLAMAALPYVMEDDDTGETDWGIVGTTPFLSIRYSFD